MRGVRQRGEVETGKRDREGRLGFVQGSLLIWGVNILRAPFDFAALRSGRAVLGSVRAESFDQLRINYARRVKSKHESAIH
jgi:hypothetical protein